MQIVKKLNCKLVVKNGLGVFKRDSMLFKIRSGLGRIPFESNHMYIVCIDCVMSSAAPSWQVLEVKVMTDATSASIAG